MCPGAFPGFNLLKGRGVMMIYMYWVFLPRTGTLLSAAPWLLSCYRKIYKLILATHDEKVVKELMCEIRLLQPWYHTALLNSLRTMVRIWDILHPCTLCLLGRKMTMKMTMVFLITVWWRRLSQLAHLDFIWNPEQGYYLKYPWLVGCSYHVAVPLVSGQKAGLCGHCTRGSNPRFSIPGNSAELTNRPRCDWELSAEVSPKESSSCQLTY